MGGRLGASLVHVFVPVRALLRLTAHCVPQTQALHEIETEHEREGARNVLIKIQHTLGLSVCAPRANAETCKAETENLKP